MDKRFSALEGDLESIKTVVDRRLQVLEELVFELLAEINGWNDAEKATYLAIGLRGPAATVLTNLPPEQRLSYAALTMALETRFGTTHQVELNCM